MLFAKAGKRISIFREVQPFRDPIHWVVRARYLDVTLDTLLNWSPHIDQVRKKATHKLGVLCPILNSRITRSIRKGALLYKQLIRPILDYARPCLRKLKVL